ncbi:hypothetical protein E6W36_07375 [Hankyongella ginsenosidimutans]|uniref:Uncharacterized protein n=1 Tax=Hankyongella ginsenosidimutans TaxID=1763828 RepID=A0A4D7C142_9SPHN|nr:hypothetical protein E6W36_07375 [Hankyongella ginsenosidimutans]
MRAWRLIRRDLALAWSSGTALALAFFLAVGVMTPFAVGRIRRCLGGSPAAASGLRFSWRRCLGWSGCCSRTWRMARSNNGRQRG